MLTGSLEECDVFRQLVWNHPCERRLLDYGVEQNIEHQIQESHEISLKRTTRTPMAMKVEQLKTQLSGELSTREVILHESCDEALNKVCLRHVSCSQLWKLFRSNCDVDHDNNCRMSDREICWQSFEGLIWTGLGNCKCPTNSSDCHWIRLHTNYNKCIYEITKSGQFPALSSVPYSNFHVNPTQLYQEYQRRYEQNIHNIQRQTAAMTTTTRAPHRMTSPTVTPQNIRREPSEVTTPTTSKTPEVASSSPQLAVSVASRGQREQKKDGQQSYSKDDPRSRDYYNYHTTPIPNFSNFQNSSRKSIPSWSKHSTRSPPTHYEAYDERGNRIWTTESTKSSFVLNVRANSMERQNYDGPKQDSEKSLKRTSFSARSSCQDAIARCEAADECRWQLSELSVRCGEDSCRREDCQSALQRFSVYVPFSLVESIMFCHCAANDFECIRMQDLLYPKCLYNTATIPNSCSNLMEKCELDQRCRASLLEQPCFCPLYDMECLSHQKHMIPNNPCIENAMMEYSRFMGYNKFTSSSFETNRISDTTKIHTGTGKSASKTFNNQKESMKKEDRFKTSELDNELETNKVNVGQSSSLKPTNKPRKKHDGEKRKKYTTTTTTTEEPEIQEQSFGDDDEWNPEDSTTTLEVVTTTSRPLSNIRSYKKKTTTTASTSTSSTSSTSTVIQTTVSLEMMEKEMLQQEDNEGKAKDESEESSDPSKEDKEMETEEEMILKTETEIPNQDDITMKKNESKKSTKFRTTKEPPIETEAPPPWESTTAPVPMTTTVFVTHTPPPPEGCTTKDAIGRYVFAHVGSVIRKYLDWSSRCSSWCECAAEDELVCDTLGCHDEGNCQAPLTAIEYGERIYLESRGACFCESGKFICDLPEEMPEAYPGLYLSVGYSTKDVELLRKEVPQEVLDKAGFVSSDASRDIASRLQIEFERLLPKKLQCRIVMMPEMSEAGAAFYRVEWYGKNEALNHTRVQWHHGDAEKECSPYVKRLADIFALSESPRFQLVLSMIRQIKVLDYLDGIPESSSRDILKTSQLLWIIISFVIVNRIF
ncbi:hypothetical protein WR25_08993 [Diploscapter pachys]|uniref:GDNF/GAS1 domain-containing protein n=1 Tax=Diploscapter pachys TaxID=2018661 RepID=A0A2A2M109_9BILA|nr:hypothetical protein WR25_08993 [Diploscapter pachys]